MTAEQVAAVLGLDENDGTTRVVVTDPDERPLVPIVRRARPTAPPPPPEVL